MNRFLAVLTIVTFSGCVSGSGDMRLSWEEGNVGKPGEPWYIGYLYVESDRIPNGKLRMTYPEAYCRSGSTNRSWPETVIPQRTKLISIDEAKGELHLVSELEGGVSVDHFIRTAGDEIDFRLEFVNRGDEPVDLQWAQTACLQVGEFTGRGQADYFEKCFIFTEDGLTLMNATHRETQAYYTPGQVYVPDGIDLDDVNPRPISRTRPINGLIGCYSSDGKMILATAWEPTHELFQGVLTCIHNDPHIGGLEPGETKHVRGKIYIMQNDPDALLERYEKDFPE